MNPAQRVTNPPNGRLGQSFDAVQQSIAGVPQQMAECVDDRPIASICAAFGVGLIAGVGAVALYCQAQRQATTYETITQRVTEALRNSLPQQFRA